MVNSFDTFFLDHTPLIFEKFLKIITFFSAPKLYLVVFGSLSLYLLYKKRFEAFHSKVLYFFTLTNLVMLVCGLLKISFGRARPYLLDENISGLIYFTLNDSYLSFPSSHSAIAAAFSHSLSKIFRINRSIYLFAAAIAFTRISLRAHFASDALSGILVGFLSSCLLLKFYPTLKTQFLLRAKKN